MSIETEKALFTDGVPTLIDGPSHAGSITAVIPAYNERETIYAIVQAATEYASEVIVVDDGSQDGTGELAASAGARVIRIPKNSGKGHALGIGLSTATMNGCKVFVCLDADGQHDPADIPRIAQPILEGRADMVIGSRFLSRESMDLIPVYRKVGQSVLTYATNLGSSTKITDSQSGYRAFTKDIIRRFAYSEDGMGIESEMIRNAAKSDIRIQEVPILAKYDGGNNSTYKPGSHGIAVLGSILESIRSDHPLLYFGVAGAIVALLGILIGMYSVAYYIQFGAVPFGPTLLSVLLITLGTLTAFVGLILNAISLRTTS